MSTKKKAAKKAPAQSSALAELQKRTAALMGDGGAGSAQADKALGRKPASSSAGSSKKTKSLYLTEEDQKTLHRIAAGLLVDGIKASESILIRAALRVADPAGTAYRREVAAMLEERGESLKAGYVRRGAIKGR